ncbi:hypothetical protein Ahy_B04g071285 [Arachis hypogaea]|uniref:CCHC-type domain-containing protein n=1 Tax=Arachis hypogaea TaxID=3818 RepID=A0A444ZKD9_ARAHY|nr:hypothetical protein Ahy_B04g071285 [Arachis hypogaea]
MEEECKGHQRVQQKNENLGDIGFLLRHGALHTIAQWMLFVGVKNESLFKKAMRVIRFLCCELEVRCRPGVLPTTLKPDADVKDPVVVCTKGTPSSRRQKDKKRKCTNCRKTGHTKRRCTEAKRAPMVNTEYGGYKDEEETQANWEPIIGTTQSQTMKGAKEVAPEPTDWEVKFT